MSGGLVGSNQDMLTALSRMNTSSLILASFFGLTVLGSTGSAEATKVKLQTSMGDIVLELNAKKAPKSVANFLAYAKAGHYDGTVFHRVISGFMVQGGGLDAKMNKRPAKRMVQNEADNGLKNVVGSVAMARTNDPHSASAQFFINVNNNSSLNHRSKDSRGWGYAVFGKVVKGMEVVNKIKVVKTSRVNGRGDVPVTPITIKKVIILK
jgi:peptidyl-prolyl cis-trans isomerase B (cyclophilin B)